ncbi:hypothetical protein A5784_34595 [Mycobacterium sp. 852013-50091_SCH5140682]|uniref:WXG100 family type VII secretion target n=1 Tax=Mycobacterium sp. 852013-50091_SCH5140682 TaxID=1834109 RepID=UPI0007E971EB|nr:hypothetical protein [Mycobacterium sp. 852013-50091_SCH5140682]OBC11639.1 hypothetical protein A5784_34595 [Mycobacterium sp. 852013-50091_SCH5140682]
MVQTPTRSQIQSWSTSHLEQAAKAWSARADQIQQSYDNARTALDGAPWVGASADRARDRFSADVTEMKRVEDLLRQAAKTATDGANRIADARQSALDAITNAENRMFSVNDDLSLRDRLPHFPNPFSWLRENLARALEADIRAQAMNLAAVDEAVGTALKEIGTAMRDFEFSHTGPTPEHPGTPGEPTITGPAGPLKYEQDKYDLQVAFPDGKGPTFGGDPQTHKADWSPVDNKVDRDPDSEKAKHVPDDGTRPIPTGTAIGPNGERLAFFSYPDGHVEAGKNPYAAPAETWDFSDPNNPKPLGPLTFPGPDGKPQKIYQPSGAYDKTTGKMMIVGNITDADGKIKRYMFESAPIQPGQKPADWMKTVHMSVDKTGSPESAEIKGMPGARESQLVALKGGGFALVGSDNFSADPKDARPAVSAAVASSAEGLKAAVPTTILGPEPTIGDHGKAAPYGPTVIDTTYDPVTGQETIDLRVSTWDGVNINPPGTQNPVAAPYDPQTYTTTITVQH